MMGLLQAVNFFAATCRSGGSFLGLPTWYKYLDGEIIEGRCSPIIDISGHPAQIGLILLAVVEITLRIAAMVAVGFIIVGGFRYITSQGEPENTNHARGTIINAIIGLVIAMTATFIVTFVARNLTKTI